MRSRLGERLPRRSTRCGGAANGSGGATNGSGAGRPAGGATPATLVEREERLSRKQLLQQQAANGMSGLSQMLPGANSGADQGTSSGGLESDLAKLNQLHQEHQGAVQNLQQQQNAQLVQAMQIPGINAEQIQQIQVTVR